MMMMMTHKVGQRGWVQFQIGEGVDPYIEGVLVINHKGSGLPAR